MSDHTISRAEAKALGLKRYFTGKPCKHGHIAERSLKGCCTMCNSYRSRERTRQGYHKAYREANRDMRIARQRAYRATHPEKARAYREANREKIKARERTRDRTAYRKANPEKYQAYRKANPEKARAYQRAYVAANPEKVRARYRARNLSITAALAVLNSLPVEDGKVMALRTQNPEKVRLYNRTWREANPEKVRIWRRAWKEANPEKVRAYDRERRLNARAVIRALRKLGIEP